MVNLAAFYDGLEDRATRQAWLSDFAAALQQVDFGVYVNFMGDEGLARVRAAYPGPHLGPVESDQGSLRPGYPVPAKP